MTLLPNTTITFRNAFDLPGFDESLPAGAYEIGGFPCAPGTCAGARLDTGSVTLRLHPRQSHPGLERSLTVRHSDLKAAAIRDAATEAVPCDGPQPDTFLDRMLADPMIRLVMVADRVSETEIRSMYRSLPIGRTAARPALKGKTAPGYRPVADDTGPRPGSPRPGIGE
jgi:hypothetical protein